MTIIKHAYYPGEVAGEPLVRVLEPGSGTKTAGLQPSVQEFVDRLEPDPRYTYVLSNAMGYSEYYGANSNTDYYGYNPHLEFNGLLHAWDGIGIDHERDRMKARDWPYGYPCFLSSTVYAHHKNTDPGQLGFGDVIYVALNPSMKRVELIERVFNEEAERKGHSSILDRIRAGDRCDVSMGCKVPFDLCSICSDWEALRRAWKTFDPARHRHPGIAILEAHRRAPIRGLAVTPKDYCPCMRTQRGKILPDGRKVFVYNDFPRFFDISFVWIGADRTARVMWFMSHASHPVPKTQPHNPLTSILDTILSRGFKAASMEKEIPGGIAQVVKADSDQAPDLSFSMGVLSDAHGMKKLLTALAALGIVASPKEFQNLVLRGSPLDQVLSESLEKRSAIFDTTVGGMDFTYGVDHRLFDQKLASGLAPLAESRSAFAPFLHPRLRTVGKTAASLPTAHRSPVLDKIAAQYNGYRISILEAGPELYTKSAAVFPGLLMEATDRIGLGGLLLGLAPVIHLLSSHLRDAQDNGEQLGSMAQFVADNPTFTSMATIGAGLRAAMEVDRAGGLGQAARSVVQAVRQVL